VVREKDENLRRKREEGVRGSIEPREVRKDDGKHYFFKEFRPRSRSRQLNFSSKSK
jgi:hypothetical protein